MDQLGEILRMGAVVTGGQVWDKPFEDVTDLSCQGPSKKDKYLVLFPSTLLMLSVSNRLSAFIYEVLLLLYVNVRFNWNTQRGNCHCPAWTWANMNQKPRPQSAPSRSQASLTITSLTRSPGPLIETIVCVCPTRLEAQVVFLTNSTVTSESLVLVNFISHSRGI